MGKVIQLNPPPRKKPVPPPWVIFAKPHQTRYTFQSKGHCIAYNMCQQPRRGSQAANDD